MKQKKVFKKILLITAIILPVLPVIVTFSSVLTSFFEKMEWYLWIQEAVVPFESRLVAVLIRVVGIKGMISSNANYSMVLLKPEGILLPVVISWNCLGWQSMILLSLTLITGLRGKYTFLSKIQVLILGILGTFLSNLFRMAFIVALAFYWNQLAARIVHDYFASFIALIWLIFFWWFSYSFVLDERKAIVQEKTIKV